MTGDEARTVAILLVLAIAPVAIVLVVALLRGYTIDVHLTRDDKPPPEK